MSVQVNLTKSAAVALLSLAALAGCSKSEDAKSTTDSKPAAANAQANAPGAPAAAAPAAAAPAAAAANFTCDSRPENGRCTEYTKADEATANKMMCSAYQGTWSSTPCPKETALGTCTRDGQLIYYFKGKSNSINVTQETASLGCDMMDGKYASLEAPAAAAPAKGGKAPAKAKAK